MSSSTPSAGLFSSLAAVGREFCTSAGAASTVYDRHGVLVVRVGDVVVKAHQADRDDEDGLRRRMRAAGALPEVLLAPLDDPRRVAGRLVTVWPYGEPVSPDDPPWETGARLLAGLHTATGIDAPGWIRPARAARTVARLPGGDGDGDAAAAEVRRAFATLPGWVRGEPGARPPGGGPARPVHGDWHLGQLVALPVRSWRLIDVEDLGLGDPAWDLARPAALFSAGVLPAADWARFMGAYRAFGGPAVPAAGDPWATLDVPARTLAIQIAATCVLSARAERRPLDDFESALVDTCARITHSELARSRKLGQSGIRQEG